MDRAYSPWKCIGPVTQADGLGWYGAGPMARDQPAPQRHRRDAIPAWGSAPGNAPKIPPRAIGPTHARFPFASVPEFAI